MRSVLQIPGWGNTDTAYARAPMKHSAREREAYSALETQRRGIKVISVSVHYLCEGQVRGKKYC